MSDHVSIERMNEALDGALTAAQQSSLDEHMLECAPCRQEYARLSEVVDAVRSLPRSAETPPDVWAEIAARIGDAVPAGETDDVTVLALPTGAARPVSRRIVLSLPQLAAAAMVVSLLSAGTVWLAIGGSSPESTMAQSTTPSLVGAAARAVSTDDGRYGEVVGQLEQILEEGRSVLTAETLVTIEQSLLTVNSAIAEVETALADDPGSDLLLRMLSTYQRTKLGVLQRAAAAVQAQT